MIPIGTTVVIIEDCRRYKRATGKVARYEGDFPVTFDRQVEFDNPRFRLEDGSVIYGVECWWKPVDFTLSQEESNRLLLEDQKWCRETGRILKEGG